MSDVHYAFRDCLVLQVKEGLELRPRDDCHKLLVLNPHHLKELGDKTVALLMTSFLPSKGYVLEEGCQPLNPVRYFRQRTGVTLSGCCV